MAYNLGARLENHYLAGSTAIILISSRGVLWNLPWQSTLKVRDTLADMIVVAIDQLYSHDACLRKIRERRWIRTLGTSHAFGMYLRVDSL